MRVMTFNLRYSNTGDGPNSWPYRKAWVAQLIRFHDADVIGVQEALSGMLADLDTLLPEYSRVGVGRTDGKMDGEYSAILYKRDRIEALESKTFWLSPTPEVPGSKGWDAALERIATWGRFRDRATGCEYVHLNTHFDHKGEEARQQLKTFALALLGVELHAHDRAAPDGAREALRAVLRRPGHDARVGGVGRERVREVEPVRQ